MVEFLVWLGKVVLLSLLYITIQCLLYKRTVGYLQRLRESKNWRRRMPFWTGGFFIAINLPLLGVWIPIIRMSLSKLVAAFTLYPFYIWMPSSTLIFFLLTGKDAWRALKRRGKRISTMQIGTDRAPLLPAGAGADALALPSRREFVRLASGFLVASPLATFTYGMTISKTNFKLEKARIPIQRLPEALEGLRICQLTDIHYESFVFPEDLHYVVRVANGLNPDLVFLTGDFITAEPAMVQPFIEVFRGLKASEGIYGCLGNHEVYSQTEDVFTRAFAKIGIEILRDQMTDLRLKGENLRLAGIDWVGRRLRPRAIRTIHAAAEKHPSILLAHNPNIFPIAASAGVALTLSGHTHGGQVALEWGESRLSLSQLLSPYSAGLYEHELKKLYVSRGIGTVAFPLRLNAPPEITLIELTRAR